MKFGRWIGGVLLCASLLLGTSCDRLKKAASGSGSEEDGEVRELGEAYVLEVRDPEYAKGFTITSTLKMAAPEIGAKVKVGQKEVEGSSVRSAVERTVVQVLSEDLRRVTVQMDKSSEVFQMTGGPSKQKTRRGPLVGQHVLLERKGDKWVARFESGKEPNSAEREAMDVWAKSENELLEGPETETRRIGEEWEEDIDLLGEGKATLRFDRVEEYQGLRCAVVVGSVKFSEKTPDGGNYVIEGRVRSYRSLDYFQDLYLEMEGEITGTSYPQLGLIVQLKGPMTMTVTKVLSNPWAEEQARKAAEVARLAAEEAAKAAKAAEEEAAKEAAAAAEAAKAAAEAEAAEAEGKPGGADAGGEGEGVEESLEAPGGEEVEVAEPVVEPAGE